MDNFKPIDIQDLPDREPSLISFDARRPVPHTIRFGTISHMTFL